MIDEGPSSEDIERFDRDTAYCPECGAEVWDDAEVCPKCRAFIGGRATTKKPVEHWVNRKSLILIVIALLAALALIWYWSRPAAL